MTGYSLSLNGGKHSGVLEPRAWGSPAILLGYLLLRITKMMVVTVVIVKTIMLMADY